MVMKAPPLHSLFLQQSQQISHGMDNEAGLPPECTLATVDYLNAVKPKAKV
jgi:hypothetical protein